MSGIKEMTCQCQIFTLSYEDSDCGQTIECPLCHRYMTLKDRGFLNSERTFEPTLSAPGHGIDLQQALKELNEAWG